MPERGNVFKIEVYYKKSKDLIYISHLDLYRLFCRALRRADLPFYIVGRFNPRPKISFFRAVKLGEEVKKEKVVFYLKENISVGEFVSRLNKVLPQEIQVFEDEQG